ncbi:glycosyltransferase family 9 protein [Flavobacterium johnsoniae]|uniref:Glycosyltransferase family 9 n=1 Tax=Flavobacterium johnsoniae (strain ATCC 17061 / DSM 2064 / JCM 8514 / BCRC 14874 / CCUG 350202 / NBRC 14942 / NCIMB 11054 / UW101) TaxID=376686 RepID=A5FL36_FLAJ1|nr:glycosyltransferase family 9 protein [Flavobacterium johnsoniae]ABQ04079.1 Glycosyltransferase family 9 [Flavobacterium johnsoniae UW101]OXG02685.1 ADP-heptose--LPS heptosyltransferase RfaF [Flavobacterium johnsoniae UW101]WQG79050.1 glycosyltransferase family 9 protein [Flavobacterium johnsoniae UW101]SHK11723.1 ADP-heptose:LPS heptosyltransferase [Flavobacterium johnsoniae]
MRLSAMGDVAMTVPVLRAFVKQYPTVKLTVISRPFFKPFFEGIPNLEFFAFDEKEKHKGFPGLLRLYKDIKKLKVDAFADLHNVLRSKVVSLLFALSGKKRATVDKGREGKKELTRVENKIFKQLPTMFQRHAKVFEELGFPLNLSNPQFPEKAVLNSDILDIIGNENQKLIGIAPFAQYNSKVYPLDLMKEVIAKLAENSSYKILLFGGGKKEIEILDSLSEPYKNVINMAGKIKFQQELQLISNLDVMLSMDSGNAHIAAMLGVKVVTLWGATHPYAGFLPFNQSLENALTSDRNQYPKLPTSVYGNKIVEGYEDAMRTILPQKVVDKVVEQL